MTDRWRFACPECGSRSLSHIQTQAGKRCNNCGASGVEPVDLKHESLPETGRAERAIADGGATHDRGRGGMPKLTVRVPPNLERQLEQLVETGEYANKSDGVRDLLRRGLVTRRQGGEL